jgi:hypothetical protein
VFAGPGILVTGGFGDWGFWWLGISVTGDFGGWGFR